VSAHEHNEAARAAQVTNWLADGQNVALVSDAGTPLLSDPGARIVRAVAAAGYDVVPVPGASALLAALVVSGFEPEPFTFFGFAARSGGERARLLASLATLAHTAVLYESPARVVALLKELVAVCGPTRRAVMARELTKLHETVVRGTVAELLAHCESVPVRGEVVLVLAGADPVEASAEDTAALAAELLAAGESTRSAAKELARRLRMPRNEAYALVLSLTGGGERRKD
jgi:16S rRNA (cytidine1402-2'-O)-methyltransferase